MKKGWRIFFVVSIFVLVITIFLVVAYSILTSPIESEEGQIYDETIDISERSKASVNGFEINFNEDYFENKVSDLEAAIFYEVIYQEAVLKGLNKTRREIIYSGLGQEGRSMEEEELIEFICNEYGYGLKKCELQIELRRRQAVAGELMAITYEEFNMSIMEHYEFVKDNYEILIY
jgi:hypothetical protein